MVVKNINDLKKFDFTSDCKSCRFRREYGLMEYCCGFVVDLIERQQLEILKKHIANYVVEDKLSKIDRDNVFFDSDDVWSVTLIFQTNLREEKMLIERELRKAVLDSPFFIGVNFGKDTLFKHEYGTGESVLVESTLDKYIKENGGGVM